MTTIQILIQDEANRNVLGSLVERRYSTITKEDFQTADLYIVDDASLPTFQTSLERQKQAQSPVFTPVILIRRNTTRINIELPEPDEENRPLLVNEILDAPTEKQELYRRITNLLARRSQTKELQETNTRLKRFASILRHELRNPLTIISGYVKMLDDKYDENETVDKIQRSIYRMEKLLEGTYVLLEEDSTELDITPIDLEEISQQSWNIFSDTNATLQIDSTRRIPADQDRLKQMLENIFRNAVEHTDENATVTVGELANGFFIEDDGQGIPGAERDKVFEEGYSTRGGGSGLGLSVVQKIAEVHGWDIRVTEGNDGGARFEVTGVE